MPAVKIESRVCGCAGGFCPIRHNSQEQRASDFKIPNCGNFTRKKNMKGYVSGNFLHNFWRWCNLGENVLFSVIFFFFVVARSWYSTGFVKFKWHIFHNFFFWLWNYVGVLPQAAAYGGCWRISLYNLRVARRQFYSACQGIRFWAPLLDLRSAWKECLAAWCGFWH